MKIPKWLMKKEGKKDLFSLVFPILLTLSVIFLILSNTHISNEEPEKSAETPVAVYEKTSYEQELASRLEEAFSAMQGVGRVKVMLTLDDDGSVFVLQDSEYTKSEAQETASSGVSRTSSEERRQTETVRDAANEPFVLSEKTPKVRGVLILAEGADSSVIQQKLMSAAVALLGVSASEVYIAPYG